MTSKTLVVKYVKSCIGYPQRQKRTLYALGLKRLGDQVVVPVGPATQGMLDKIDHLVQVVPDETSPDAASGDDAAPDRPGTHAGHSVRSQEEE